MQVELKKIQRDAGITFIFVTHDQEEAMRMSDRIVVFNEGRVEQVGTPQEVYNKPATRFVAGFLGAANILSGEDAKKVFGKAKTVSIRPERIRLEQPSAKTASDESSISGTVHEAAFVGANTIYLIETEFGFKLNVSKANRELPGQDKSFAAGDRVLIVWHNSQAAEIPA
jgi:putative spermidine/putrescine transport system ATP-binding protein